MFMLQKWHHNQNVCNMKIFMFNIVINYCIQIQINSSLIFAITSHSAIASLLKVNALYIFEELSPYS
jgi:hypothetical protein